MPGRFSEDAAIGNLAGVITPIVSGYILTITGSHGGVLAFVAAPRGREDLGLSFF
jgi:hypothetical protein